jgi:hypothetical protein
MSAARRALLAVAVLALVAAAVAGVGVPPAGAFSPPTLAQSLQQLSDLDASISLRVQELQARRSQALSEASTLRVAADRVDRLESQLAWVAQPNRSAGLQARLARASAALTQAQAQAVADNALPQTFALQRQIRRLQNERRSVRRLIAEVQAAEQTPDAAGTAVTRGAWAATLLRTLGAPVCGRNLVSLVAWQSAENTTASWNPLATTLPAPGAQSFNRVGVKNYPSMRDGIDATVATLRDGWTTQGYGWIVYRLSQCADPTVTVQAINASNWCRGCTNGRYVTDTLPFVENDYAGYAER